MNKNNKSLAQKIIPQLFLIFARWYLRRLFQLSLERDDTKQLEPPYLILGNHANFWDGFLVNLYIKEPISFLVSDEYFRKPVLGWLLRVSGSIAKKKFLVDFSAIKEALKAKSAGRIIGIFPEGKRNWSGSTDEITFATAKLIKMLNIPVVCVLLKGSHLAFPRWARFSRKGKISSSYKLVLTPEKIQRLSFQEIYSEISKNLYYREYDYQRTAMNLYQGKNLAEKLELFLFLCPQCHQIGSLVSRDDTLYCQNCGYKVRYNQYGFLTSEKKPLYFDNPDSWNQWQIGWIEDFLHRFILEPNRKAEILQDKGVNVTRIVKQKSLKKMKNCILQLTVKKLILKTGMMEPLLFEVSSLKGLNVQYNNQFEFYYQDELYKINFDSPSISAYKWYKILKLIQNINS
jgi:1-acyl-sn-glycerol-3-phosphate acyltransferase